MTSLSELRFFTTPPHDCSYLDDREAITLFVDPLARVDKDLYSALSEVGFRRSGSHIYRPWCQSCSACIPVRVPVQEFAPTRRHRRIWKRNQDLTATRITPALTEEYFELYERYITTRHADGDMYPADIDQFRSFLVEGRPEAVFVEFRDDAATLVALAVVDELNNGLSAIYTAFDPEDTRRSLGVYAVLWLIEHARHANLTHLYLGYWIKQCQKMSYKTDYQPLEMFVDSRWIRFEE